MKLRNLLITMALVALTAFSASSASAEPTTWGSPGTGNGQFSEPSDAAVAPNGDVYIADRGNHRIQYFTASGKYLGEWGSLGTGQGKFGNGLVGVAVSPSGRVFALDNAPGAGGYRIQRFDANGAFEAGWGTEEGSALGQFDDPSDIAAGPNGRVYVTDSGNQRVQSFEADGSSPQQWGVAGTGEGEFTNPAGIAINQSSGEVYVADNNATPRLQAFSSSGSFISQWGNTGNGEGQFPSHGLLSIAVGPEGDVYTREVPPPGGTGPRFQRFTGNGGFVGVSYWTNSTEPRGLAVSAGALYAPDTGGGQIQVFDLRAPSVSLLAPYTPVGVGQTVHFQSTAWVPLGQIVDYEWDLNGDGVYEVDSGAQSEVTHVYTQVQKLTASLRVRSDRGGTAVDSRPVEVVVPPPSGPVGVSIDNGAQFTNDPNVTVELRWPQLANRLLISNDGGFVPASSKPVAAEIPWHLSSSGPERLPKTIYVRFGDSFWMDPQTYQDDIILDQTAPTIPAATLVLPHRGPDRLRLTARDNVSGVSSVQLRKGNQRPSEWRNFASSIKLPHGARGLRVRVRDRAGNDSKWVAAELNRRRR
jgi:hypothetical protein